MSKTRWASFALLSLALVAVLATPAWAQEEAQGAMKYITGGGWIGYIILALSVVTVALVIQYAVNIRRDKICPPEMIDELEALLEENELQEALELCESEPNFVTNSLAAGLPRVNEGYEKVKEAVEATAGVEAVKLQQRVGWLFFLSNVGPLLGLFGTVTGMIAAFDTIVALGAKVTPKDLAIGISLALVTTFQGLVVAIPAVSAYQFFRNKATRVSIDFANVLEDMIERFKAR